MFPEAEARALAAEKAAKERAARSYKGRPLALVGEPAPPLLVTLAADGEISELDTFFGPLEVPIVVVWYCSWDPAAKPSLDEACRRARALGRRCRVAVVNLESRRDANVFARDAMGGAAALDEAAVTHLGITTVADIPKGGSGEFSPELLHSFDSPSVSFGIDWLPHCTLFGGDGRVAYNADDEAEGDVWAAAEALIHALAVEAEIKDAKARERRAKRLSRVSPQKGGGGGAEPLSPGSSVATPVG